MLVRIQKEHVRQQSRNHRRRCQQPANSRTDANEVDESQSQAIGNVTATTVHKCFQVLFFSVEISEMTMPIRAEEGTATPLNGGQSKNIPVNAVHNYHRQKSYLFNKLLPLIPELKNFLKMALYHYIGTTYNVINRKKTIYLHHTVHPKQAKFCFMTLPSAL